MSYTLDFETALEILQSPIYDDECSYMGAVLFVSEAFNISVDRVLESLS